MNKDQTRKKHEKPIRGNKEAKKNIYALAEKRAAQGMGESK